MLVDLNGKSGCFCEPAKEGKLRCPLNVRATSEDVITGNIFGVLKAINPRWWLPQILNKGLHTERFRQQVYRRLTIDLWQKQPRFPRHLISWDEGQTEVDVEISWDNRPTTIFIEMKYGSPVSRSTVHNNGQSGHASDQIARNIRLGLYQCGWYTEKKLFDLPQREFALLLISPHGGDQTIEEYRDPVSLLKATPYSDRLQLPEKPFVGELSYRDLVTVLKSTQRFMSKAEQVLTDQLDEYLSLKLSTLRKNRGRDTE